MCGEEAELVPRKELGAVVVNKAGNDVVHRLEGAEALPNAEGVLDDVVIGAGEHELRDGKQ